jgi:hypothetical protein
MTNISSHRETLSMSNKNPEVRPELTVIKTFNTIVILVLANFPIRLKYLFDKLL